jgi:hypothetical protein
MAPKRATPHETRLHTLTFGEREGISTEIIHLDCQETVGQAETLEGLIITPLVKCHTIDITYEDRSYAIGFRNLQVRFLNADKAIDTRNAYAWDEDQHVNPTSVKITEKRFQEHQDASKVSNETSGKASLGVQLKTPPIESSVTGEAAGRKATERADSDKSVLETTKERTVQECGYTISAFRADGGGILYRIQSSQGSLQPTIKLYDNDAMRGLPVWSKDEAVTLTASVSVKAQDLSHQVPEPKPGTIKAIYAHAFLSPNTITCVCWS